MRDSIFFTEIFTEVVLKGRVRIAERPLCGPLRLCELCVLSPEQSTRRIRPDKALAAKAYEEAEVLNSVGALTSDRHGKVDRDRRRTHRRDRDP